MSKTITNGYPIKSFSGITVNTSLPSSSKNYYSYSSRNVKYIVIHYTGNSADTAKANANYFNGGSRSASAHYFVDDTHCYQSVALNNAAWAVGGTSKYKHADCRNKNSISVEMCCFKDYMVSKQTEENAAYLCAELCKYIGITADTVDKYVLRHWDVWSKDCPSGWTGSSNSRWNGFKDRVKAILKNESEALRCDSNSTSRNEVEDLTMAQYDELKAEIASVKAENAAIKVRMAERTGYYNYIDSNMPESYRPTIQKLVGNGYLQGNEHGELMLTTDMMRILTILDRIGALG